MAKLKPLSGDDLLRIFGKLGFRPSAQRGSHVKLLRPSAGGARQILTIPLHRELDKGTLKAIYRQALRFVPESELKPHFYSE
jgi:predicted RNA binding protein YcfA (HicA-like mRNA interferase family)